MTDIAETKRAARKAAFARRAEAHRFDTGAGAERLAEVLQAWRDVPVSGFLPIRTEIDPRPAMATAAEHGPVAVPVIEGKGRPLRFSRWTPGCALREGPFGAMVPELDDFIEPEVLVVPLVAFDRAGGRLGYGGGFYDRTLEMLRGRRPTRAIGFAYAAQEAEALPLEPTDQPLDMVVTEAEVICFGA
jgi:5-formyltetrahydrofolate cyclo-ligase